MSHTSKLIQPEEGAWESPISGRTGNVDMWLLSEGGSPVGQIPSAMDSDAVSGEIVSELS